MASVPWTTDAVTDLPFLLSWADGDDASDDFVAWHTRECAKGAKVALLQSGITVTDTASGNLDQDVAFTRSVDWNVLDGPRAVWALEDDGFAGLWDLRRHVIGCVCGRIGGSVSSSEILDFIDNRVHEARWRR